MYSPGLLEARLHELRGRYPAAAPEVLVEVVKTVLETMEGGLSVRETRLLYEIEELSRTIASAKSEIAALGVEDITASHIPSATDELDAIVEHTAAATDAILETCETLDGMSTALEGSLANTLQDATTKIYEACSFQDITGQRITKVVATLKTIERKLAHISATFADTISTTAPVENKVQHASLLNGPQLPAVAMEQSDIDALLASFD